MCAKVCGRCLRERDTSNKPFERTGRHKTFASPPQTPCLPLKGSVRAQSIPLPPPYHPPHPTPRLPTIPIPAWDQMPMRMKHRLLRRLA